MAVIVVVERRARTGQAEALIAAAQRLWTGPWPWSEGRRHVRLFQGTEEPDRLLYVAEWESAESYWANRRGSSLDALSVTPAPPRLYTWRRRYENLARTPSALDAVALQIPRAALDETLRALDDVGERVRAEAGLVLYMVCQDTADAGQLLILEGWASPEAQAAHRQRTAPALIAAHRARGVRVDVFVGRPRGEDDQWTHLAPARAGSAVS
ncbi:MAG TPA: antibiotic biosynthesis monooxygenase [Chloroflexota bacterium]|nr:antibiotic biosynthesis monooxygenase [Chloroflexota bacterium]